MSPTCRFGSNWPCPQRALERRERRYNDACASSASSAARAETWRAMALLKGWWSESVASDARLLVASPSPSLLDFARILLAGLAPTTMDEVHAGPHIPGAEPKTAESWGSVEHVTHLWVETDSAYRWSESQKLSARVIGRLWKSKFIEVDDWVRVEDSAQTSTPGSP